MRNSNALKVDIEMRHTYGRYICEILYTLCKTVDNSCETVDNFGILSYKVCKTVDNSVKLWITQQNIPCVGVFSLKRERIRMRQKEKSTKEKMSKNIVREKNKKIKKINIDINRVCA